MEKKKFDWKLLKRIIQYLKPNKKKLTIVAICILITTMIGFFQPLVVKMITDDGLINQNFRVILSSVLLLLGLVLINQFIEVALASLFADIHNESEYRIYSGAFRKLLRLKPEYFTDRNASEVINAMSTDVSTVSSLTDQYNVMLISYMFRIISGLAGLIVISPFLTILVLATVPIKYFTVKKLANIREAKTSEYIGGYRDFASWMSDTISGVKEIKLWNGYQIKEKEFTEKEQGLLKQQKGFTMIGAWNMFVEIFLGWFVSALLYVFGGMLLIHGKLSLGGLFAFISYSSYVTSPISAVLNAKLIMARIMPSARRLFEFLDLGEETSGAVTNITAENITFENVCFSYNDDREVLRNISFSIPKGSKVAIIGPNGSGKSTIIHMLLRFLEPKSGKIEIGKVDIKNMDLNEYRELFSVVSQNPYLFNRTIKENIDLGSSNNEKRLAYVYQKSGVAGYLEKMPNGEDSIIGDNGARLSGGEKQKLAVARALMKDTPYVILDEATSGFDATSDAYLHDVIINEMKDKTVLLITHKYENLEGTDMVYRIEDGEIERIK